MSTSDSQKFSRQTQAIFKISILPLVALLFSGVSASVCLAETAKTAENPAIKPGDDRAPIEGKVLEKIDASNYSYLRLKTAKGEVWVAVPESTIKVNANAVLQKPIPMFGFESKTLKRKFDQIYFGVLTEQAEQVAAQGQGHWIPGMNNAKSKEPAGHHAAGDEAKGGPDLSKLKTKKAEGNNAVTVAELFQKKTEVNSKNITLRGKIIKYNADILGKNWIHVADGTGSLKAHDFDVTVITQDRAKLGDTVLITGKVVVDKKLDSYYFPIAIEDAKMTVTQ